MDMVSKDEMFIVGEIVNTHGVKGEVRVKQITDFVERFDEGNTIYLQTAEDQYLPLTIESSRFHKHLLLIRFKEYRTLDEAEELKGLTLHITKEQQMELALAPNQYYYHEIIECKVYTTEGEEIGVVDHILAPGANDVWVVKTEEGKEHLIPYIPLVVKEVDIAAKKIIIEVMEGLLD